nr:RNA-binding protein 28-like isoform X2 [Cherax quadricarinatus]
MSKIPKPPTVTVVVKNLPVGTTEDQLRSLCENFGGIVEVEIPNRVVFFTKFIFGFVRFVSLDAALNAVKKLNGLVVQRRRITAEVARSHWRNTNEKTVLHEAALGDEEKDEAGPALSEDELDAIIMDMCHQQWQQHRRRQRHEDLPSFGKIMEILSSLPTNKDENFVTEDKFSLQDEAY